MGYVSPVYNIADLSPFICLACVGDSRAYGSATPESDEDIKGAFIQQEIAELHCVLDATPQMQLEISSANSDDFFHRVLADGA